MLRKSTQSDITCICFVNKICSLYILHCKIQSQYNIKKDSMKPMQYPVDVCGTGTR